MAATHPKGRVEHLERALRVTALEAMAAVTTPGPHQIGRTLLQRFADQRGPDSEADRFVGELIESYAKFIYAEQRLIKRLEELPDQLVLAYDWSNYPTT
jgi:hypothetical protein